jgi:hypothetical protein
LAAGHWEINPLLSRWHRLVGTEGQWQPRCHGGYRPVAADLVGFMARDKKASHDLTFVLDGPRGVEPVPGVVEADVLATLADMGCAP